MKPLILCCMMLLCLSLMAQTPIPFTEGTGTADDPVHIDNFGHLYYLTLYPTMWSLHYIQTADIDATESTLIPSDEGNDHGWWPIGRGSTQFTGSYDGQDYQILNLSMNRPNHEFNGLFGYIIGGKVTRVHLVNAAIQGGHYAGALSGVAHENSIISHCSASGMVSGTYNVGGLIGFSNNSLITNSYAHVSASGWDRVGGFIGTSGWQDQYTYITYCYSTGTVSGSTIGGFSGWGGYNRHLECYWDTQSSGLSTDAGLAMGKSTAEMMQQGTFEYWNFDNIWSMQDSRGYPTLINTVGFAPESILSLDDLEGQGSADDPYLIYTVAGLNTMRLGLNAHYSLMADLDLSETVIWDSGRGWQAVGTTDTPFTGSFAGNDHTITALYINRPNIDQQGLFGYLQDATVHKLNMQDIHLMGQSNCGAVAGHSIRGSLDMIDVSGTFVAVSACGGVVGVINSGSLQRSFSDVLLKCQTEYGGALAGYITSATDISGILSNSGATGSVSGNYNMGGLVGAVAWGYIINSYSHVSVYSPNQAGGIVGLCGWSNPGYIIHCYATGTVSPADGNGIGGIAGWLYNGRATECYWDQQSSGTTTGTNTGIQARNTAEMMQQDTFANWNFNHLWQIDEGSSYPTHQNLDLYPYPQVLTTNDLSGAGTSEQPYLIHNADELNVMRQNPGASYKLANDIDLSSSVVWNSGMGWETVGNASTPFTGTLDGDGKQILGLSLVRPLDDGYGLIGEAFAASVHNLKLLQANILANTYVGGVTGIARQCSFADIDFDGAISAQEHLGGIVGFADRSTVINSHADVSIIGYGDNYAGGLVGYMISDAVNPAYIQSCSSNGRVRGYQQAGGLVGCLSWGRISDSFSHAMISGYHAIGGAVGKLGFSDHGTIERCYATGYLDLNPGGWGNGGLVGYLWNGTATSCYFDVDSCGTSSGTLTGITGLTTAQMTYPGSLDHYSGWDFVNTWQQDVNFLQNGGYPYLNWNEAPVPDGVQNLVITAGTTQINLQWQAIAGVSRYHIYASDDPYAPLHAWSYIGESAVNSFSVAPDTTYRFFLVRSVGE